MMILFFFLVLFCLVWAAGSLDSGHDRSVEWHSFNGGWRVIYPDGARSQRFTRAVADDYRKMFGGQVVRAEK